MTGIPKQLAPHRITNEMMVFAEVARLASFTKAALHLGLGRARVSQIVSELEARLGVRLLNRSTRSLSLTETGANYLIRCSAILELSQEATNIALNSQNKIAGTLRVKIPVAGALLIPIISAFIRKYPHVRVELIESDTPVDMIETRTDVAFASGPIKDRSVDLAHLDWISHLEEQKRGRILLRKSGQAPLKIQQEARIITGSVATIKAFLLEGSGFAILPSAFISSELQDGSLVRILPKYQGYQIPILALYGSQNLIPLKVQAFIDFVKANLHLPEA